MDSGASVLFVANQYSVDCITSTRLCARDSLDRSDGPNEIIADDRSAAAGRRRLPSGSPHRLKSDRANTHRNRR